MSKMLKLESELKFGKHAGKQLEDLIEDEPDYVRWLCENTSILFADECYEALERREQRK